MNPLKRLGPRERRLTLITGVLIGCWAVISWIVQPLMDRVREVGGDVDMRIEKLKALTHLLEHAASVERDYQTVQGYLEKATDERVQGSFLDELESLSRQTQIRLSLKPRAPKQDDLLNRLEVELEIEGSQENLFKFLDLLLQMPKLISIERLRIGTMPARPTELRANLVVQKLSFR